MTLLGSGYNIEQVTPSQLQVLAPASGFVWIAFALAACATAFFLHRMYKRRTLFPALGVLLIGGPLVLTGVRFAKNDGILLDKDANRATAYHPSLLGNSNESVPLSDIGYAELRVMGKCQYSITRCSKFRARMAIRAPSRSWPGVVC